MDAKSEEVLDIDCSRAGETRLLRPCHSLSQALSRWLDCWLSRLFGLTADESGGVKSDFTSFHRRWGV